MVYRRRRRVLSWSVETPEKFTTNQDGRHSKKRCFFESILRSDKEKIISFWQTNSLAIITTKRWHKYLNVVRLHVQSSQRGEVTIYQRSSTTTCFTYFSQKCLAWSAAARCSWAATGNCRWEFVQKEYWHCPRVPTLNNAAERVKTRLKKISEFMEYQKTTSTKTRSGRLGCKFWLIDCKMEFEKS